jgi:hypothetical protein
VLASNAVLDGRPWYAMRRILDRILRPPIKPGFVRISWVCVRTSLKRYIDGELLQD